MFKIFAGGNHSWVVLDDIIPVREKYRPPSPLPERQPSLSPRIEERIQKIEPEIVTKEPELDFEIEITYSPDSQMIHRFINFEYNSVNQDKILVALQSFIQ